MSFDFSKIAADTAGATAVVDSPEAFLSRNRVVISRDRSVQSIAEMSAITDGALEDLTFDVQMLPGARLTYLQRKTVKSQSTANKSFEIVSGTISNLGLEINVHVDGETMPLSQFLYGAWAASIADAPDYEAYLATPFVQRLPWSSTGTLFFTHMGALTSGVDEAFGLLRSCGAQDSTRQSTNGSSVASVSFNSDRVDVAEVAPTVTSIEINRDDRKAKGNTRGQGVMDLVTAQVEYQQHLLSIFGAVRKIESEIPNASGGKLDMLNTQLANLKRAMTRSRLWAGIRPRVNVEGNKVTRDPQLIWDNDEAKVGRIGFESGDNSGLLSFWTNNNTTSDDSKTPEATATAEPAAAADW